MEVVLEGVPPCINLAKTYGHLYRISFDPAHSTSRKNALLVDPWMHVIPCRIGDISPQGGEILAWYCEGHKNMRGKIRSLPFTTLFTEGDSDGCYLFHYSHFDEISKLAKPYRKRVYSDSQLKSLRERAASNFGLDSPLDPTQESGDSLPSSPPS